MERQAALALADILTQQGLNVGIAVFEVSSDPTNEVRKSVVKHQIKQPDMPMDLGMCAFAMCEIAYTRIVAVLGGARHLPGTLASGLGCVAHLPSARTGGGSIT